jgi:hypothetical protein
VAYRARVAQILALYDVTPAQLRAFVAGYGANEEVVAWAYRLERARIDALASTGTVLSPGVATFEGAPVDTLAAAPVAAPAETVPPIVTTPSDTPPSDTSPASPPADTTPSP